MYFIELLRQLNDFRLLAAVRKLHGLGRVSAARRKIFEIVVSREDRFGKNTVQSAEPLVWLAQEHVKRAFELIELWFSIKEGRSSARLSVSARVDLQFFTLELLVARLWQKEMRKAFIYFGLAKFALPSSPNYSILQLEIEMYLGIVSLAGPFDLEPDEDPYRTAMRYMQTAVATAYRVLENSSEYRACDAVETLIGAILAIASDEEVIAVANQLKIDAAAERSARQDYSSLMALLGRTA